MREKTVNILLVCCLAAVVNVAARNLEIIRDRMNEGGETVEQAHTNREVLGEVKAQTPHIIDEKAGTVIAKSAIDREGLERCFISCEITEAVFQRIRGKSYQEGGETELSNLRYLKVLHYNFEHEIQVGELIVSAGLAEELCTIFQELFLAEYEIQSMRLIDDYWTGDGNSSDEASIQANNSSAFCYRVIAGKEKLSRHAYGCAVDINPLQNPCVAYADGIPWSYPEYSAEYVERRQGVRHVITEDDVCCRIFKEHGFSWGGDWSNPKDYQHFEKRE